MAPAACIGPSRACAPVSITRSDLVSADSACEEEARMQIATNNAVPNEIRVCSATALARRSGPRRLRPNPMTRYFLRDSYYEHSTYRAGRGGFQKYQTGRDQYLIAAPVSDAPATIAAAPTVVRSADHELPGCASDELAGHVSTITCLELRAARRTRC